MNAINLQHIEYLTATGRFTNIFFLGIGGIGMSALARYCQNKGYNVSGYDRTSSRLTTELVTEGISVIYDERVEALPECFKDKQKTLVILTPAIPAEQPQLVYFREMGFYILKRAELLGIVTRKMKALCVAGTHGKTTTSTILAHLMYQSEVGGNAFLGGISNNYGTNLLTSNNSNYVTVEADEYDRSFHQLTPFVAIITSADPDHLDIYGSPEAYRESFEHFTSLIQKGGALIMKKGIPVTPRLQTGVKLYTYSATEPADFYADNIRVKAGNIYFDFHTPSNVLSDLKLGVPVWINIENSVAAMAVAWLNGVTEDEIRLGLASYTGIYRRFNIHVNNERIAYIDDYAHHPTEIKTSISSIRRLYPDRQVVGIFQPHLYTRTRDFADGFAAALSLLDKVILLPVYPARELPIEGVDSNMLLTRITSPVKTICEKAELCSTLPEYIENRPTVVVSLGAGDIDRLVESISRCLINLQPKPEN